MMCRPSCDWGWSSWHTRLEHGWKLSTRKTNAVRVEGLQCHSAVIAWQDENHKKLHLRKTQIHKSSIASLKLAVADA